MKKRVLAVVLGSSNGNEPCMACGGSKSENDDIRRYEKTYTSRDFPVCRARLPGQLQGGIY